MLSCLSVPNCIKIGWPTAKLWRHTYFQDGGRGRSILFPVSYLLMSLPSKQISSTRLNSRLRTHYMYRNVSLSSLKSRKFRIFGKNLPLREKRFFHTPLHSTPPLGGSRQNIRTPFGMEKLEWCGYPTVKKFRRYVYSFWRDPRTWQTNGQTDTAWQHRPRLHSIAR